ncbi:MAG TPA: hypothetical protein VK501_04520 [Baekduia sp.]|uniref:hypothetical protein n=1 Tax=Baekduia sp. TaxID=2600305 RepID=UPI002C4AB33D|nr:hypothetical protein [Baekduia sp.]HMJ33162.1 hypothetical protein [Baekduia sp.]
MLVPSDDVSARILPLKPSDLADDVTRAVAALGGEAQRVDIIDRALEVGGWTNEERAVVSRYVKPSRTYHLRTLADYAVTTCKERGNLVEVDGKGRWRLAGPLGVASHPHGRVFTAGVGLGTEPVGDDWNAADSQHLWFTQRSLTLSRGDHVFALGAGRKSVVLGLFEVTSGGTERTPVNPWDPTRWPWAIAVRPLAAVPPPIAHAVPGLTAPRGTANAVGEKATRDALYAVVREFAVADEGGAFGGSRDPRVVARRARPFDLSRAPATSASGFGGDDSEARALREKAQQGHHQLLAHLHTALDRRGWSALEEIPAAIDLRGQSPVGESVIFEAKTINESNETSQCRGALAQLLEYRLEYGQPDDRLVVVVDNEVGSRRSDILERLGVAVVLATPEGLAALNQTGQAVLEHRPVS